MAILCFCSLAERLQGIIVSMQMTMTDFAVLFCYCSRQLENIFWLAIFFCTVCRVQLRLQTSSNSWLRSKITQSQGPDDF